MKPIPLTTYIPSQCLPSDHLEPLSKDFHEVHCRQDAFTQGSFQAGIDDSPRGQQAPCEKGCRGQAASVHSAPRLAPHPHLCPSYREVRPLGDTPTCRSCYDQGHQGAGPPFRSSVALQVNSSPSKL